ncbi:MAG: DNA repair protein RadC [Opitutales bacterium]|nr:DNA repair protein RadC [Opitutales bacterium]
MNKSPSLALGQKLKEMAAHERPQERLERLGATALTDTELLAMLLRSGSKDMDVMAVSRQMMLEAGSLAGLLRWDENDFRKIKGIGHIKALQLMTVTEIARRVLSQQVDADPLMDGPEKVYEYLLPRAAGLSVEKFWVLCLNRKNRLIRLSEVTSGTASNSPVHCREVFKEAVRCGATAIICAHNHPTGDPSPSIKDREVTDSLRAAGEMIDIQMLDHVIIGSIASDPRRKGFFSFKNTSIRHPAAANKCIAFN